MLNDELKIQNYAEQIYLINSENDLSCAFLTKEQSEFFRKRIKNIYWQPRSVEDWMNMYELVEIKDE